MAASAAPASNVNSDRFHALLVALVGQTVQVTVKPGVEYRGILAAAPNQSDLSVVLKQAQLAADEHAPVKPTLLVQPKDLVDIRVSDLDIVAQTQSAAAAAANGSKQGFRTDTDISASTNGTAGPGRERMLQSWGAGAGSDAIGGIEDDIGGMTLEESTSNKKWDQFAANERLYGMKSDYNEETYTTRLDRSGADFRAREQRAAQLEREILQGTGSKLGNNAHMAEERGLSGEDGALDEEDRYGAVIRGPNAYIPPQARKGAAVANGRSTQAGAPQLNDPAIVSTTKPEGPRPTVSLPTPEQHGLPRKPGTQAAEAQSTNTKSTLEGSFRDFVSSEKERLSRSRQAVVKAAEKKDKDTRLASLLEFSQTFKLKAPMPADLATMLGRDPNKVNSANNTPTVSPVPAPQTTAQKPVPPAGSAAYVAAAGKTTKPFLPEIPPYNPNKAKKSETAPQPAPADDKPAPAAPAAQTSKPAAAPSLPSLKPSTSKMSANAPVFRPNPNAAAFTPGASAAATPAPKAVSPAVQPAKAPAHPFFGDSVPKKGSSSLHVKEEFTPFKNGVVPEPSSIGPQWAAFTGKSYRAVFVPGVPDVGEGPSAVPPMPMHPAAAGMPPQAFVYPQQYQPVFGRFAAPHPSQMPPPPPPHAGQLHQYPGMSFPQPGPHGVPNVAFSPSPHAQPQPMPGQPFIRYGPPQPGGSPLPYPAERPGQPPSSGPSSGPM